MPDTVNPSALAEVKISELPVADQANLTDQLEANQAGVSRSITVAQVGATVDVAGQIADATIDWTQIINEPATFPPTLPIAQADVTNLVSDLAAKAPIASPHLTGVPTAPTAAQNTDTTQLATCQFVNLEIGGQLGFFLPLAGGTLTGPLISNLATAPNQSGYRVNNYALTGANTTGAFVINGSLNTTGQPDIFAINITDTSNAGGSAFVIKGGPTAGNTLVRADMAGDFQNSGWSQCMSGSGLPAGGAYYYAAYIGNNSGGNVGTFAGTGAPSGLSTFGRYGSIYLNGASPGIPYYNNNGTTGWDQLVGLTATQTLTNKTFAPASVSPGSNGQVLTTVSGATAWAANAGGPPSGTAGGDLAGTYPNPTVKPSATNYQVLTTVAGASAWANAGVLQTVSFESGVMQSGTGLIPFDDTIPQITEGNEYMTLAITPKSATSKLVISVTVLIGSTVANNMGVALFQDATANALAAAHHSLNTANLNAMVSFRHMMTSGTTSATTFRVRIGGAVAGTTYLNGNNGVRIYGGVAASSIVIQEVT